MQKMKHEIFEKMDENLRKQTATLTNLTNKNTEQDKRLDKIEANNHDMKKRIEELEKNGNKTWASVTQILALITVTKKQPRKTTPNRVLVMKKTPYRKY